MGRRDRIGWEDVPTGQDRAAERRDALLQHYHCIYGERRRLLGPGLSLEPFIPPLSNVLESRMA